MAQDPLAAAITRDRGHLWALACLSGVMNLLMLTGPLYMMNVYDRVLPSGSLPTLVALSLIAALLIALSGLCDILRARLQHRLAARLHERLAPQVFALTLTPQDQGRALADLDSLLRYRNAPAFLALFDLPFSLLFLGLLCLFHISLGVMALATAAILLLLAGLSLRASKGPGLAALAAGQRADTLVAHMGQAGETLRGLGMRATATALWQAERTEALQANLRGQDITTGFGGAMRAIRLLVQSAMLGWGAALVLAQAMGGGAMIVSAILLGRALAPIEVIAAHWPQIRQAQNGRDRLAQQLCTSTTPPQAILPPPQGHLALRHAGLATPQGRMILHDISLNLAPGQLLQVIGPSGAGKSALVRLAANILPPQSGEVTLDGAPLHHYPADRIGRAIGYLPQNIVFFQGNILRNIARLDASPDPHEVLRAAQAAQVHDWILTLPQGYETPLDATGGGLSGGQLQRLALARALYGAPCLLILDEPESHLDERGRAALHQAIAQARARGAAVLHATHDFAQNQQADLLLCLSQGRVQLFGPRGQVVAQLMQAAGQLHERQAQR